LALQKELKKETKPFQSAGQAWSIVECISKGKTRVLPPTFQYFVQTITLPGDEKVKQILIWIEIINYLFF
jgi:hypothetical protein